MLDKKYGLRDKIEIIDESIKVAHRSRSLNLVSFHVGERINNKELSLSSPIITAPKHTHI
jgi:hypothetical protein